LGHTQAPEPLQNWPVYGHCTDGYEQMPLPQVAPCTSLQGSPGVLQSASEQQFVDGMQAPLQGL
jgi:hypothetical protein